MLAAAVALTMGVVHAQSDDDEDEMGYYPLVPGGNLVHFGLRFVGGPKVSFGHLGFVPANAAIGDTETQGNRSYNDGTVSLDARTDRNGNAINDGFTNTWSYTESTQVTPTGDIAFHAYSATSLGAGRETKVGSAAGWELQMGHSFGRIARKIEFSVVAGFTFSDMNAKSTGIVPAQLVTTTDVYSLDGQPVPTAPYTAPSSTTVTVYDSNGNLLVTSTGTVVTTTRDNTTLITSVPISRTTTTGTIDVHGRWQVKGSYYTLRLGPMIQIPLSERFKISLGAGFGMAYVGSNYVVDEEIDLPDTQTTVKTQIASERSTWLPVIYADADAEYWLTERTGFYLGATGQKSSSYDQTLEGRTAKVDLGTTYGLQSGITLRF